MNLNGSQRSDTNKQICKYVGTYNNFQNTLGIFQKANSGLIFQKQAQRKNFLSNLLGIDLFEKLNGIATQDAKQTKVLLKQYQNKFPQQQIQYNQKKIQIYQNQNNQNIIKLDQTNKLIDKLKQIIIKLDSKIVQIVISDTNIEKLQGNKLASQIRIEQLNSKISNTSTKQIYQQIQVIQQSLQKYNVNQLSQKSNKLKQLIDQAKDIKYKDQLISKDISICNAALQKLGNLQYDPNCKFCMNNIFVKDAISSKDKLVQLNIKKETILDQLRIKIKQAKQLQFVKQQMEKYNITQTNKNKKYQDAVALQKQKQTLQKQLLQEQEILNNIIIKITQYNNNKTNISNNILINEKKNQATKKLQQQQYNSNTIQKQIQNNSISIGVLKQTNNQLRTSIIKINQLQTNYNIYTKYIQSVSKNGIPLRLIQQSIPLIQLQTNDILSMLAQFTLQFTINQNNIDITRVYDINNKLPVQMGSGFQQTVSDISVRIALSKIANTPRSNIVIIDENFGALDSNNIMKVQGVLQYLKQSYQYVLIISHIDILKSMVDDSITIIKQGQYSKINF